MKRAADGPGDRGASKQPRGARGEGAGASILQKYGQHAFKVLVPEGLVAKMMGEKGAIIHQIEDQTTTHLQFSPRGDYYPGTRYRVLTVIGPEIGLIQDALIAILDNTIERTLDDRERPGEFIDDRGRIIMRCALSKAAAGAVIGPKGEKIRKLRESVGAHIDIDRDVIDSHQLATIAGSRDQIITILEDFNETVQADANEAWFPQWASQRSIAGGEGGPRGGGDRDRERREPRGDDRRRDDGSRRSHGSIEHKGCTIFIGRLAQATTTDVLRGYFEQFGEVVDADVRIDANTGRSKGFGFITFAEPQAVNDCMELRERHEIDERWVDVKRYSESGGGGGGGDDRGFAEDAGRGPRGHRDPPPPVRNGGGGGGSGPGFAWGPGGQLGAGEPHPSIPWFCDLASEVNPEYLDLNYCISCSLPSAKCGALIGRKGETVSEVQRLTGCEIVISKKDPHESADAHRTVSITGPLVAVYAAHMILMRHYNDEEAQFQAGRVGESSGGAGSARIEDLERQLAELSQELHKVRGGGGGGARVPRRGR